jgi:hypothetical protein
MKRIVGPLLSTIIAGVALLAGCGSQSPSSGRDSSTGEELDGNDGGREPAAEVAGDDDAQADAQKDATTVEVMGDAEATRDSADAPADLAPGPDHALCQSLCDTFAAVPCLDRAADCVPVCESQIKDEPCPSELRALHGCVVTQGPDALVCMPPIGTVRRPGYCQPEADAYRLCHNQG